MVEDVAKCAAMIAKPARECARCVELDRVEALPDLAGNGGELHAQRIAQRMRGVSRDDESSC